MLSRPLALLLAWLLSAPSATAQAADPPDPYRGAVLAWYDLCQRRAAREAGIDWLLAKAVRVKESFHDASYISETGAVGLMQLMPTGGRMYITPSYRAFLAARRAPDRRHRGKRDREWAEAYRRELSALLRATPQQELRRLDRRFDPCWNMRRGTFHLAADLRRFRARYPAAAEDDLRRMTLAAYFAGPGRVRYRGGKPVFLGPRRAIQRYVDDLLGVYRRLRAGLPGR